MTATPTTEPLSRRITVIGTGYLGATHAACLAELGYEVLGVDTDEAKIAELGRGVLPFFEPGLPQLLATHTASGRLRFGTCLREAAEFADVHFVCVGTPQLPGTLAADTSQVFAACRELTAHLASDALIVGKSTVPVGTAQRLQAMVSEAAPSHLTASVAWNPEFLREGHGVADTLHPGWSSASRTAHRRGCSARSTRP